MDPLAEQLAGDAEVGGTVPSPLGVSNPTAAPIEQQPQQSLQEPQQAELAKDQHQTEQVAPKAAPIDAHSFLNDNNTANQQDSSQLQPKAPEGVGSLQPHQQHQLLCDQQPLQQPEAVGNGAVTVGVGRAEASAQPQAAPAADLQQPTEPSDAGAVVNVPEGGNTERATTPSAVQATGPSSGSPPAEALQSHSAGHPAVEEVRADGCVPCRSVEVLDLVCAEVKQHLPQWPGPGLGWASWVSWEIVMDSHFAPH